MHTNPNQRAALWLAGWYTLPDKDVPFASRRHAPATWPDASAWLHQQLHLAAPGWEPSECASMHVEAGNAMGNLVFRNCLEFIEWAVAHRQGRGIWGRDAHRCYYVFLPPGGESGDRELLTADVTPPLMAKMPPHQPVSEEMAVAGR